MMITITIDQSHIDEALNALCDCSPADIDEAGNQLAAIEAIHAAINKSKDEAENQDLEASHIGPTEAVCRTCEMQFFGGGVVPAEGYECERCKSERGEA